MSDELPPDDWKPQSDPDLSYEASYRQPPPAVYAPAPPTPGKAIAALILGIISLVMCGCFPFGIAAWVMGKQSEREILLSRGALGGDGIAKAGWITGMIGTIGGGLYALGIAIYLVVLFSMGASGAL